MDCPGTIKSFFPVPLCEVKCSKVFTETAIMITTLRDRMLILVLRSKCKHRGMFLVHFYFIRKNIDFSFTSYIN